jgi:Tol biopolymer transport system component
MNASAHGNLQLRGLLIAFALLLGVCAVLILDGSSGQATFPGENGHIFFAGEPEPGGSRDLYRMDPDGSNLTPITDTEESEFRPSVTADGSMIAYQRSTDNGGTDAEIFVANADGSGAHQVSTFDNSNGGSFSPSWSPDGTQIAFAYSTKEAYELWVMDADGDNPQMIADNIRPTTDWSTDGDRILFTKDTGDSIEIAIVNPDGTDETQLTFTKDLEERAGGWSPDGEMIVGQAQAFQVPFRDVHDSASSAEECAED